MSAPVLTKEQVKTMRACLPFATSGDDATADLQGLCDFTEVLRAELEAVSERCVSVVKDRDRWNEMYNAEHRKHVNAVVALRAERDALAAKVAELERKVVLLGEECPEQLAALNDVTDAYEAAEARVARMLPVVEAALERRAIHLAAGDDEAEQERRGLLNAEVAEDVAVDDYRAKEAPDA